MEDKKTISLTKKQRELLLNYEPFFADHDIFRLISIAILNGNNYEIYLDDTQVEDLIDQVSELCNHEENEKKQNALDKVCDYLETFSSIYEEKEDFSQYSSNTGAVFTLKVALEGDPKIWRKIDIRGGQTLEDLHCAIFDAFDRDDEHLYSYFFPRHPLKKKDIHKLYQDSDEYTHPYACEDSGPFGSEGKNAAKATIQSLNLTERQVFYYLFDFGDEWWHEITVEKTGGASDNDRYPRIIERKGDSPQQYPEVDEEW